jgi:glycosyltransferase involved in cell wall biosynthesis
LRILIASGIFHPDSGGPATYLYHLLPALQAQGHSVRVLCYGDAPTAAYPYPVQRISFRQPAPLRWLGYALAYRRAAAWADLIYINTLGLPRSGDARKPRLMKIVGDYAWERCVTRGWLPPTEDIDQFQGARYSPRVEAFKTRRAREARSMNQIIVPSQYLHQMVAGWGVPAAKISVIYNALEQPPAPAPSQAEARQKLGWPADSQYLFTAARLTAWKGIDHILRALPALPNVQLVIAGDGPEKANLTQLAAANNLSQRVQFLGKVAHQQMALYLAAADYLILYSGYEGLSHTILESLYVGTPVLASARGGNPETVIDGLNGLLIPHPNPQALTETIGKAFLPGQRQHFAANTGANLDKFGWAGLVAQTSALIDTLAR